MYARSLNRKGRYDPPPGYAGVAFGQTTEGQISAGPASDGLTGKIHRAEELPDLLLPEEDRLPESGDAAGAVPETPAEAGARLPAALDGLLRQLREHIGAEELILLLVMLLCASERAGVEVLLLALLLVAGRES